MTNEVFANSPTPGSVAQIASLASSVTTTATSWTINAALPTALQTGGQFHALLESELVVIPTQSGTSLTGITRGAEGSTKATHAANTPIYPLLTAAAIQNALSGAIATAEAASDPAGTATAAVATETSRAETAEGTLIPSSQKGAANGVATLDASKNVPLAQLGNAPSGGSATPPVVTQLGSIGATITLPSANENDLMEGTLTANTVITPPAAPTSPDTLEFDLKLVQNGTGGFTWSFAGSVTYPAGTPVPVTAAGAVNWLHVKWDGSNWNVFPATSATTVVSATAFDNVSGAGGRWMGTQSTGVAPTQSSPVLGDWWTDTALPGFWVYNTAWQSVKTGSGGGPALPTATTYDTAAYDPASSAWVAESRPLVDITAHTWGGLTVSTANADNGPAINAAIETLGKLRITAYLPAGAYNIQTQINIGDGVASTGLPATYTGGLVGAAAPMYILANVGQGEPQVYTSLVWNSTTVMPTLGMVTVNGPVSGWELTNVAIVGNATQSRGPAWGLYISSGQGGRCGGVVTVSGTQHGVCLTTITGSTSLPSGLGGNCSNNHFEWLSVNNVGLSAGGPSYGILVTNTQGGGGGNACYNRFDSVFLTYASSGGVKSVGLCFQACDSNRIGYIHVSGSIPFTNQVLYDYSVHNVWPAGNVIEMAEFGNGAGAFETGSLSASAAINEIRQISTVNGRPATPSLQNTTWNSHSLTGTVTLVAGTKAITVQAADSLVIKTDSVGQYVRCTLVTPGGTPGGYVLGVITQNTITFTSYQPGTTTTQTADTSTYFWELVTS